MIPLGIAGLLAQWMGVTITLIGCGISERIIDCAITLHETTMIEFFNAHPGVAFSVVAIILALIGWGIRLEILYRHTSGAVDKIETNREARRVAWEAEIRGMNERWESDIRRIYDRMDEGFRENRQLSQNLSNSVSEINGFVKAKFGESTNG